MCYQNKQLKVFLVKYVDFLKFMIHTAEFAILLKMNLSTSIIHEIST